MSEKVTFTMSRRAHAIIDETFTYEIDKDDLLKIMEEDDLTADEALAVAFNDQVSGNDLVTRTSTKVEVDDIIETHSENLELDEELETASPR